MCNEGSHTSVTFQEGKFVSFEILAIIKYVRNHICRSAQYYVDLLKLIAEEGSMSVLHDERERVLIIMESVGELT